MSKLIKFKFFTGLICQHLNYRLVYCSSCYDAGVTSLVSYDAG